MQKTCTKCKEMKSTDDFYLHRRKKGKTYLMSICKMCCVVVLKERRRKQGITGERSRGEKNPNAKLREIQVYEILWLRFAGRLTFEGIGRQYGVNRQTISSICSRKSWVRLDKAKVANLIALAKQSYQSHQKLKNIFDEQMEQTEKIQKFLRAKQFLAFINKEQ